MKGTIGNRLLDKNTCVVTTILKAKWLCINLSIMWQSICVEVEITILIYETPPGLYVNISR